MKKANAALVAVFVLVSFLPSQAQSSSGQPFVVEYYYKTKWGHADEFLKLFKKNHYPLLKKETEMGRMLKVWIDQPRYHTTEDGRWDFRVTIVFKNATVATSHLTRCNSRKNSGPIRRLMSAKSSAASKSWMLTGTCR